ncbi:MHC class I protein [NY_014 poxvirus]|uniref:MHC class I protein n=1 Tax=NY_014 poxvirus TaxID=2025360 RepID=UPI000B9A02A8|nr:MHC class I protein [NY_014 poxvirus]AST09587.1 MHC class I protein [NY_014 poxvirus]
MRIIVLLTILQTVYSYHTLSYKCVAELRPTDTYNISINVHIDNIHIISFNGTNITYLVNNDYVDDILYHDVIHRINKFYKRNIYNYEYSDDVKDNIRLHNNVIKDIKYKLQTLIDINNSSKDIPHVYKSFYECTVNDNGTFISGTDSFTYDDKPYGYVNYSYFWIVYNDKLSIVELRNVTNLEACINYLNNFIEKESNLFTFKIPNTRLLYSEVNDTRILECLSTGFFPSDINIQWIVNGKNITGTKVITSNRTSFIGSSIIHVPPTDGGNYTCVVHHQSLKDDIIVYKIIEANNKIITTEVTISTLSYAIYAATAAIIISILCIIVYILYKHYHDA